MEILVLFLLGDREAGSASSQSGAPIVSPIVDYSYKEEDFFPPPVEGQYTQSKLWGDLPPKPVAEKKGKTGEVLPISWIFSIAESLPGLNVAEYDVTVDESAPAFSELNNWLERVQMRADGSLVYKAIPPYVKDRLPALWTETQSNPNYSSSVNKTARGVIAQLRCLRRYSDKIDHCIGFMFPSCERASMVVRIDVQWQHVTMVVRLQFLNHVEVREHVVTALRLMNDNRAKLLGTTAGNYFIRLSEADLRLVVPDEKEKPVQINSKHSIIVETRFLIYKVPVTYQEAFNLSRMLSLRNKDENIDRESVVL